MYKKSGRYCKSLFFKININGCNLVMCARIHTCMHKQVAFAGGSENRCNSFVKKKKVKK